MLRLVAGTVFLLLVGLTEALAVEEIKKDNLGPWEIEATFMFMFMVEKLKGKSHGTPPCQICQQ